MLRFKPAIATQSRWRIQRAFGADKTAASPFTKGYKTLHLVAVWKNPGHVLDGFRAESAYTEPAVNWRGQVSPTAAPALPLERAGELCGFCRLASL
jgi:hypothetical protein